MLEPLWTLDLHRVDGARAVGGDRLVSWQNSLLRLALAQMQMPLGRESLYAEIADRVDHVDLLLGQLRLDDAIEPPAVAELLQRLDIHHLRGRRDLAVQCILAHLGPGQTELAGVLHDLMPLVDHWKVADVDAQIRCAELGLPSSTLTEAEAGSLVERYAAVRTDFVGRIPVLVSRG
ncbi:hypothetical protein ACIA5D_48165 [Actinoplanes sp. NPDC051513]|uniref:hypothetical protein n=1 Tax=Actinoplanes sp. NPDC051513 TaxID=3363908 RepID=UPI0037BCA6AB